MNWGGVILWIIGEKLYKNYREEKIRKLESEKADDKISTQCDSCTIKLRKDNDFTITGNGKGIMQNGPGCRGFITGWYEGRFRTLCSNCYEKLGVKLSNVCAQRRAEHSYG